MNATEDLLATIAERLERVCMRLDALERNMPDSITAREARQILKKFGRGSSASALARLAQRYPELRRGRCGEPLADGYYSAKLPALLNKNWDAYLK